MTKLRAFVIGCAAVLLLAMLTSCTWEEVKVTMNFSPGEGEVYDARVVADQDITQTIDGKEAVVHQKMGFGFSIATTEVDEAGNSWCDYKYSWILIEQELDGKTLGYDSDHPEQSTYPQTKYLNALLGKGFSAKITPAGDMLEVAGIDELIEGLADDMGITDSQDRASFEAYMQAFLSEDALRDMVGETVINYPTGNVDVGDTWTSTRTATMLGVALSTNDKWELQDYKAGLATVSVVSTVGMQPGSATTGSGSYPVGFNLSGTQEGTYLIDVATGLSLNGRVTQSFTGEVIEIVDGIETRWPMTIKSVTTIEMSKVTD